MKCNINKILKHMMVASIIVTIPVLFTTTSNADSATKLEFESIIDKYNTEDVIVENGIVLNDGETLDLSQYPNWEISNDDTVKIDESGILTAVDEGTVYISQEIEGKIHIIEIYVSEHIPNKTEQYATVNRDYYKVFIDPGHGGKDSGALGSVYRESDLNLQIAKKVESKLKAKGIEVKMSRNSDVYLELKERADASNAYQPDVFVSIHQNSYTSSSANGIESFYHSDKSYDKPLSDKIQTNLIKNTGASNRGVKSANFGVLRMSINPASLVECGFITNPTEHSKLGTADYQDKIAIAIVNGIEQYLKENVILGGAEESKPVIKTGTVKVSSSLKVRAGYGTSYAEIGKLYNGERVNIVDEKDGWYQIQYKDGYGYVSTQYIILDETKPQYTFSDIQNHWAKDQIQEFANKGYINGYVDGTFRPESPIRRDEFVKIVNRIFGFTQGANVPFTDMIPGEWNYNEVAIAVKEGYIDGYPNNTFGPADFITRESAAKAISEIVKLKGDGLLSFNDVNLIGDWAKPHVDALTDHGIIQGGDGNNFMPQKSMTRAEVVTMLSRIK